MSTSEQYLWVEKYRPRKIEDCILTDDTKSCFQQFLEHKEVPNMILAGGPGVGKTTVAKALCAELDMDHMMINGSLDGNIDTLRTTILDYASAVSFGGGRKAVIIDEADYLNPQSTQPAFRGVIEEFEKNCSFIFTCNYKNRLIDPIHSRCAVIEFSTPTDAAEVASLKMNFARRLVHILKAEEVAYDKKVLVALIERHFPDFRRTINELQRYSVAGKIDEGILKNLNTAKIKEVIPMLREKEFTKLRKWVSQNLDQDPVKIMREIYDEAYNFIEPAFIPLAVVALGKYMYQNAFSADKEINLMAFLSELMLECQFRPV